MTSALRSCTLLRTCFPHGNTQTWTVTSEPPQAARMCRRRRHGASGASDPPPPLRRKTAGCGEKMRVLLSRPASRLAAAGAGGVVRSDKGTAEPCRANRLAAAGAERTARPQKPPQRLRGGDIRHQPPRKAAANVTKPAFFYASPQPQKNKIEETYKTLRHMGGLRHPPYAFRVPRF